MPMTPTDAVLWIRSAATINKNALTSVCNQAVAQLAEIELFPNTPAKGQLRDAVQRIQASYARMIDGNGKLVALCNVILTMLGSNGLPDPPIPPNTWSTGNW